MSAFPACTGLRIAHLTTISCRTRRMMSTDRRPNASAAGMVRALLVNPRQAVEHVGDIGMEEPRLLLRRAPSDSPASAAARSSAPSAERVERGGVELHGPLDGIVGVTVHSCSKRKYQSDSSASGHSDPQQQCNPPCSSISAEATSAFDTATGSTPARRMRAEASASSRRTPETK